VLVAVNIVVPSEVVNMFASCSLELKTNVHLETCLVIYNTWKLKNFSVGLTLNSDFIILVEQALKKELKKDKDLKRIGEIEERISWIVSTSLFTSLFSTSKTIMFTDFLIILITCLFRINK